MVSSLFIPLFVFMYVFLSLQVIKARRKLQVPILDNNELYLQQRIRAQANFGEYTPLFAILLLLAEVNGFSSPALAILAFAFLLGRIFHAYAFLKAEKIDNNALQNVSTFRMRGMQLTLFPMLILAAVILAQFGFILVR